MVAIISHHMITTARRGYYEITLCLKPITKALNINVSHRKAANSRDTKDGRLQQMAMNEYSTYCQEITKKRTKEKHIYRFSWDVVRSHIAGEVEPYLVPTYRKNFSKEEE